VDGLSADPSGRDIIHFDAELPRFGVRVKASGVKSYLLQYRNKFGQLRRITIGRVGDLTPDEARRRALILRADVAKGADPSEQRRADRNALTVADLCEEYLEAAKGRIKETSYKANHSELKHHVIPLIGSLPVATITPATIEKLIRDVSGGKTATKPKREDAPIRGGVVRGGPAAAFRAVVVFGSVLQRAVRDRILASNPVREISRPRQQPKRPPPFSFDMITHIGKAVREREMEGERIAGFPSNRLRLSVAAGRGS
jgi:hypothetical protein